MARMPAAAAATPPAAGASAGAPAAGADAAAAGGDGAGDAGEEDEGDVIATIVAMPDGTFKLYAGDEPDEGEDDGGGEGGGEEGAAGGEGGEGDEEEPESQEFDSVGELMKGVLEIVQDAAEKTSGKSSEDQFNDGFKDEGGGPAAKA